jgi:hypothetical protein
VTDGCRLPDRYFNFCYCLANRFQQFFDGFANLRSGCIGTTWVFHSGTGLGMFGPNYSSVI